MNEQVLQESCENSFNLVSDKEQTSSDNQESSSSDLLTDELHVSRDKEMVTFVAQLSSICTIASDGESENVNRNETVETDNGESSCTNVNKQNTVKYSSQSVSIINFFSI